VPVDAYEIPARIRRAVLLRHPWEVFPYSARPSPRLDLDHTRPCRWDGTPGQTDPDNLGPLSRKVHRAKTRAGWRLRQPRPGLFVWRSPLGRRYWITPDGLTHNDPDHRPRDDPGPRRRGGQTKPPHPTRITPAGNDTATAARPAVNRDAHGARDARDIRLRQPPEGDHPVVVALW
ncbi:MAG: hypothetical protein WCF12_16280, partial [Propionicimonas sp.]